MCYPVPGPRCSNHAYAEFVDAEVKFSRCVDPALKLVLGAKLEEKRAVYETTPRGINELRRAADLAVGIEREELLLRLARGETARKSQLKAYHHMVENKGSSYLESMRDKGYTGGRYQDACGIAALFLTKRFPDEEFHTADLHTIVSDHRKIFVIPEKYTGEWDKCSYDEKTGYQTEDVLLAKVFKESLNLSTPSPRNAQLMMSWFVSKLGVQGYTHIAAVNRKTEDVMVVPVEDLPKLYSIKFKLRKRIGGSTSFRGNVAELTQFIVGTVFEQGKIIQPVGTYRTVIYGVPPQAKKDCVLNDEVFLSWRDPIEGEEGYFEVRRRHASTNFDVVVVLSLKRDVLFSGVKLKVDNVDEVQVDETVDDVVSVEGNSDDVKVVEPSLPVFPMFPPVSAPKPEPTVDETVPDEERIVEETETGFDEDLVSEPDEFGQDEYLTEDEYPQDEQPVLPDPRAPKKNIWF